MTAELQTLISSIRMQYRTAAMAFMSGAARPVPAADDLLEMISGLPISESEHAPARIAFEAIMRDIEVLPLERSFEPALLAGELLAACLLRSAAFTDVARDWVRRPNPVGMTCVGRGYSKVADFDASRVDVDVLLAMVERIAALEPLPREHAAPLGYVSRVVGKLKATDVGTRVIEELAHRGTDCRIAAAHAIAFDFALAPPLAYLSVFPQPADVPHSPPPPRRLFWLFASLLVDPEPEVARQAQAALEAIRISWPDVWNDIVNMRGQTKAAGSFSRAALRPDDTPPAADAATAVEQAVTKLAERTGREWTAADLQSLTQADLARPDEGGLPRGVAFALRLPEANNAAHGVLTWDPELLRQEAEMDLPRTSLRPIAAPRLFISYRWSLEVSEAGRVDYFAGRLHMRGYDIVFDRHPLHLDKGLDANDVLLLMYGCTHFVPFVTEDVVAMLNSDTPTRSPVQLEWELARSLARSRAALKWLGIWVSGESLPKPLSRKTVADVRESWDALDDLFPTCMFRVESIFKSGKRTRSRLLRRVDLSDAIAAARARPGCVDVAVYDVTERGPAWGKSAATT
jgi:hypothetical protein